MIENKEGINFDFLKRIAMKYFSNPKQTDDGSPLPLPMHPGYHLKEFFMPRLKLSDGDFLRKTGISRDDLTSLFNGGMDYDEEIREKLRPVLKGASDILYNHQQHFNESRPAP